MYLKAVLPAVLVLGSVAVRAQEATAPVITETVTGAPVVMKLNLTTGQVRAYKITVNQNSTVTQPGAGQGMPVNVDLTTYAKLFVDKKNPDNSYAVRYRVGGTRANVTMNGAPLPMPGLDKSMEFAGVLNPDGSFKPSASTAQKAQTSFGMDPSQMMTGMFANLMSIPDRPVAIGDTWITKIAIPMDPTGASVISVTNKILSMDPAKDDQVARIQQEYSGPISIAMTSPMPMTMTGTMSGSGISRVSVNTGQTISHSGSMRMNADMAITNAAGNGETMNMKMDTAMTTTIESVVMDASTVKAAKPAPKKVAPKKKPAKSRK